jgi:AcrR family transcriptional regulator
VTSVIERRRLRPVGRPDEIRAVAIALFAERGYRGTSMKDIATALSMQAPSLYNHVDAKETLLRDVILETLVELQAEIDAIVTVETDPVIQLLRMTEAHVLYHAQHPACRSATGSCTTSTSRGIRTPWIAGSSTGAPGRT